MGANTSIEWADHTFNPWIGCTKISPGCDHCYAERLDRRTGGSHWGAKAARRRTGESYWKQSLKWNRQAQKEGCRYRVFCASLADVFDNQAAPAWRADLWDLIEQTPHLDWLLLTKRPQNIERMLPDHWIRGFEGRLPENIWLGISAENQKEFNRRWPVLQSLARRIYPTVIFVSLEPLLGPISLEGWLEEIDCGDEDCPKESRPIDWVIVGGESGSSARPMHPEWVWQICNQCRAAAVPFFFKQWGEWCSFLLASSSHVLYQDGELCANEGKAFHQAAGFRENPRKGVFVGRVGKALAGRLLDGREWNEMPGSHSNG